MQYLTPSAGKDPELWKVAQLRASFKQHLATFTL